MLSEPNLKPLSLSLIPGPFQLYLLPSVTGATTTRTIFHPKAPSEHFSFFSRIFLVSLQRSAQDVFSDDVVFENSRGPISFNADKVYSGFLEGIFFGHRQLSLKIQYVKFFRH